MRRVASLIAVVILTASCGLSTSTTTTSTTSEILSRAVSYSSQEIGTLPGAVDLIQRDIDDSFFYVVSRFGTIQRWQPDGTIIDTVLDISTATTSEGGAEFIDGDSPEPGPPPPQALNNTTAPNNSAERIKKQSLHTMHAP